MSASEKLKALDGRFEGLRVGDTPPPIIEVLFWPQIVAVVGAAERAADVSSTAQQRLEPIVRQELSPALTALEEALS